MTAVASLVTDGHDSAGMVPRLVSVAELASAMAVVGLLAIVLYRPWQPMPFPIVDFGGWLVTLTSSDGPVEAFRALAVEHAHEGRLNPLSMAYVALNWAMFGDATAGWQLLRAMIMLGVAGGTYVVIRMLGAPRGAALLGASLYVVADSARAVWLMPQAFEHVAAVLVIAASAFALGYYRARRRRAHAVLIAALLVCAVWVREPMVAAIPFVLLLAVCHRGLGRLVTPRVDRRTVELVTIVGVAVAILNVVPVLAVRTVADQGGYASRFGPENISVANIRNVAFALGLPVTRALRFPANAMFILAVAIAAFGRTEAARDYRRILLLAVMLPLCAAAIYVMWPGFPGNYGLPYLLGLSIIFALTLATLWRRSTMHRAVAVVTAVATVWLGSVLALNDRRQYAAARQLDADMASAVASLAGARHLEAAVDDPPRAGAFGRALRAYARATLGAANASATDIDCATAQTHVWARPDSVVLLRPPHGCLDVEFAEPTTVLRRTASIRDWKTFRSQAWDVTAALWHSGASLAGTAQ